LLKKFLRKWLFGDDVLETRITFENRSQPPQQTPVLKKVIENVLRGEEKGFPECLSILQSEKTREAFGDFYDKYKVEINTVVSYLQHEYSRTEVFDSQKQYIQTRLAIDFFPGFLKQCHEECLETPVKSEDESVDL